MCTSSKQAQSEYSIPVSSGMVPRDMAQTTVDQTTATSLTVSIVIFFRQLKFTVNQRELT